MALHRYKAGSEDHARLLSDIEAGFNDHEVARRNGVSANTVFYQRSKYGYPSVIDIRHKRVPSRPSSTNYTEDEDLQIRIWSDDGLSYVAMHALMPHHLPGSLRRRLVRLSQIEAIREIIEAIPPEEPVPEPEPILSIPDVVLDAFDRSALADMADRLAAGEPWDRVRLRRLHGLKHYRRMRVIDRRTQRVAA